MTDPTTGGSVIPGAKVTARSGTETVGQTHTKDGLFTLAVNIPGEDSSISKIVELVVEHAAYENGYESVEIDRGEVVYPRGKKPAADEPEFERLEIELRPKGLNDCSRLPENQHGGVVGDFGTPDFPDQMVEALTINLGPQVTGKDLDQPVFLACKEASPKNDKLYGRHFADVLKADVFLSGSRVKKTGAGYDFRTYVSDRYGVFEKAWESINKGVNLDDAEAESELEVQMLAAILVALARGLQEGKDEAKCVDMTRAADNLLGLHRTEIKKQRQSCQEDQECVDMTRAADSLAEKLRTTIEKQRKDCARNLEEHSPLRRRGPQ